MNTIILVVIVIMAKNHFSLLPVLPDESKLIQLVSLFEYRRVSGVELPTPLNEHPLTQKCNSFVLSASGHTHEIVYSIVGIRPDKGDVIDEHPYVLYYNRCEPSKNFGGIIHHGSWPGRTVVMETWQMEALAQSGLTAEFTYKSIPPDGMGSLYDLYENGMLAGITKQFEILYKRLKKFEMYCSSASICSNASFST